MLRLNPTGALFRSIERILTALAAAVAAGVTLMLCRLIAPELHDPLSMIGSAVAAVAIFFNIFGIAVLLLLLPWEVLARLSSHQHE